MVETQWFDILSRVGWPTFFIFGLYKGWWRMGNEFNRLEKRNEKLEKWLETSLAAGERTAKVAERHVLDSLDREVEK